MLPYRFWNANSMGFSGSLRLYKNRVFFATIKLTCRRKKRFKEKQFSRIFFLCINYLFQIPLTVFSAMALSSCFISENWMSEGSPRRGVVRKVSPSLLLMVKILSSPPSAKRFPVDQHPLWIFRLCFPTTGMRLGRNEVARQRERNMPHPFHKSFAFNQIK